MKLNKQIKNWWIDALLMAGYLFCFYLDLTGVAGHQWLGAALGILAVIHLWLHLDWVKAVTKRLFDKGCARNRWYYLLDVLIVVGFIVILETGLIISTWFDLVIVNYIAWLDLHTYASYATLGLIVVKVGAHWRWVLNVTRKIWGENGKNAPQKTLAPGLIPVPVKNQPSREVIDRRQFLLMMGAISLGSILAVTNVLSERAVARGKTDGNSTDINTVSAAADSPTATTATGSAQQAAGSQASASSEPVSAATAAAPAPTEAAESTAQSEPLPVAGCSVQCPQGCAYPGRCRRYTDQNGNGLCDLGECL